MNEVSVIAEPPKSGHIRIDLDHQYKRQGFQLDVACLENRTYRVQLEECALSRQHQITLLERVDDLPDGESSVVRQLFTYDLNRAFEVVEHLMSNHDPRVFCQNLAIAFQVTDPDARIPLDANPS